MKENLKLFLIKSIYVIVCSTLPSFVEAQTILTDQSVEKVLQKQFDATGNKKLSIDNTFGDIAVHTWQKQEFKIDIFISVKKTNEQLSKDILNSIEIQEFQDIQGSSLKTVVHDSPSPKIALGAAKAKIDSDFQRMNETRNFKIRYIVYMPASNDLDLKNTFGNITMPDFQGKLKISNSFGSIQLGNVDHCDSITLNFGSAKIGKIHDGVFTCKFLNKFETGELTGRINILNISSSLSKYYVGNDIKQLNINHTNSPLNLFVQKGFDASLKIKSISGKVDNETNLAIDMLSIQSNKLLSATTDANKTLEQNGHKINIVSAFSDVRLLYGEDGSTL